MRHVKQDFWRRGVAWLIAASLLPISVQASPSTGSLTLESGYQQMYNLDFEAAHRTFAEWERLHPEDPLGPVSNAAAFLFAEFDRMHILESELFTNDAVFEKRQ